VKDKIRRRTDWSCTVCRQRPRQPPSGNPQVVLNELVRSQRRVVDEGEVRRYESELGSVLDRQKKLTELFTLGAVDSDVVREQGALLKQRRAPMETRLSKVRKSVNVGITAMSEERLAGACEAIRDWLDEAAENDRALALEALQRAVIATPDRALATGVIPSDVPAYLPCNMRRHDHVEVNNRRFETERGNGSPASGGRGRSERTLTASWDRPYSWASWRRLWLLDRSTHSGHTEHDILCRDSGGGGVRAG
jgi:hypothetical protein